MAHSTTASAITSFCVKAVSSKRWPFSAKKGELITFLLIWGTRFLGESLGTTFGVRRNAISATHSYQRGSMVELSRYAMKRLAKARRTMFTSPVTAYLTNARIVARTGLGVMHGHIRTEASGRFGDGHRIRTSDVLRTEHMDGFWMLHTWSGSHYVIVTFDRQGGRRSLDAFNAFSRAEFHLTHRYVQ